MAEYTGIGQGTYNTVAGSIGLASAVLGNGGLGNLFGGGWNRGYGYGYGGSACLHDVAEAQVVAEKDSIIAELKAERYADKVRDDAKDYGIAVYKELKQDITELKDNMNRRWTEQAVLNEHQTDVARCMEKQIRDIEHLLHHITRTAIPSDIVIDFDAAAPTPTGT